MLRIGIIGAGNIAQRHLKAYLANPEVKLVAVCDENAERAKACAEANAMPRFYGSYRELLADPEIDAVSVATPTFTHKEIVTAALKSGKHVLCEKPPALNGEEALEIEQAAAQSDRVLMYGFVVRFSGYAKFLKTYVDAGKLGPIRYAEVSRVSRCNNIGGWFRDKSKSGGGELIDAAIHELDLALYLMDYPKAVRVTGYANSCNADLPDRLHGLKTIYASVNNEKLPRTVESFASGLVQFENGASLYVRAGQILNTFRTGRMMELCGDKGAVLLDKQEVKLLSIDETGYFLEGAPRIPDDSDNFQNEINHFVDCCQGRAQCICAVRHGTEIMKIISGIYRSAELGREVLL